MKRIAIAFLLFQVLCGVSSGQEAEVKVLTPLVGTWEVAFDWPGIPFEKAIATNSWQLDGKYMVSQWRLPDGKELGAEIFTWNPVEKKIQMWGFDGDGFYQTLWSIDGNKFTAKYRTTTFSGQQSTSNIVLHVKSATKIVAETLSLETGKTLGTAVFTKTASAE
jgi:hypothetical protein